MDTHARTRLLIGDAGLETLRQHNVLIAGLGGVGSFAAEAVARAGTGKITLLDHDEVVPSNLNRQLIALRSTIGQPKAEAMAARISDINPAASVHISRLFLDPANVADLVTAGKYGFVIDCIDSILCKAALVHACQQHGIPVISAMGAGGRMDASQVKISTLNKTHTCPLAREMRRRLRALGASLKYPVVFSEEIPVKGSAHQPVGSEAGVGRPRSVNGTISYLPGIFGLMMAGFVVQAMLEDSVGRRETF